MEEDDKAIEMPEEVKQALKRDAENSSKNCKVVVQQQRVKQILYLHNNRINQVSLNIQVKLLIYQVKGGFTIHRLHLHLVKLKLNT